MTRLVEAMQKMGLDGEAGSSGRWIRFPSGGGRACVVEAAWGEGYHAFYDASGADAARDEPPAGAGALFLDPVSAIEACLPRAVRVQASGDQGNALPDTHAGPPAPVRHCEACGAAAVRVGAEAKAVPARWGEVWLCDNCLRTLPATQIERRTREIALRGVPLS